MAVQDRITTSESQESVLRIKLPQVLLLYLKFLLSVISEPTRASFSFFEVNELLKTTKLTLCASTFSSVSAVDHPLLIAIPQGSGGDSVVLSAPWLQCLLLLDILQFTQPQVSWLLTKAFP